LWAPGAGIWLLGAAVCDNNVTRNPLRPDRATFPLSHDIKVTRSAEASVHVTLWSSHSPRTPIAQPAHARSGGATGRAPAAETRQPLPSRA